MELAQILQQYRLIAGVDEVGRGPLVGQLLRQRLFLTLMTPLQV